MSGVGDVNGDDVDDLLIGTFLAQASYVVFGKTGEFGSTLEDSALDVWGEFAVLGGSRMVN